MPSSSETVSAKAPQEHPEVFDLNAHNKLRHSYITSTQPNLRKAMEHVDIILQHSIMDNYMLQTLSKSTQILPKLVPIF
jgi:hypothetical protein